MSMKKVRVTLSTGDELEFNQQEERELRRVFDYLSSYSRRNQLLHVLNAKEAELKTAQQRHFALQRTASKLTPTQEQTVTATRDALQAEVDTIRARLEALAAQQDKSISVRDLDLALRSLGRIHSHKELEFMVWEVDESLDECVSWEEFQLMYHRNLNDSTGLEPFRLFNIVQFMTYDQDFKGHITEDDVMETLFARYGKGRLETELHNLFGNKLKSLGGEGVLTLGEYLDVTNIRRRGPDAPAAAAAAAAAGAGGAAGGGGGIA